MTGPAARLDDGVDAHLASAVSALFGLQRPDGSWLDTLSPAAVVTATAIVGLRVADPAGSADLIEAGASWLRRTQNADGGWGDAPGTPSTLIVTPTVVGALALVAPAASAEHVRRGLARIEGFGGMDAVRDPRRCKLSVMCEIMLALGGLHEENQIRRMPLELVYLPRRLQRRMSFIMPILYSWGLMQTRTRRFRPARRWLNRSAEPRIRAYLTEIEAFHGEDGGFQDSPLMVSLVCLGLARAGLWPDIVERCVRYLRASARADGSWSVNRCLCFSATTWVTLGLQLAAPGADPRLDEALAWITAAQRDTEFTPTGAPPGGWGWSVPSGWIDSDDTADALLCLAQAGLRPDDERAGRGVAWLRAMQNSNGSWSCFCRDGRLGLDAPCAAMTAHAVLALHTAGGAPPDDPAVARALRWFGRVQRPDGAIAALWYRGLTAGTGSVLEAFGHLGLGRAPVALRCRDWLLAHQRPDGGWGDGCGAPSTCEETAWALLGLLAGDVTAEHPAVRSGVAWLTDRQRPDGLWDPAMVGFYFFDLSYSNDMLAAGYAVQALARYERLRSAPAAEAAARG
jgi:squalene-hopene/tetraprenyl-beta-curcumene cyclase